MSTQTALCLLIALGAIAAPVFGAWLLIPVGAGLIGLAADINRRSA